MASVNKVILVGNLGKDPETRYAPSGDAICNITLATTDTWRDKNSGEKREATEWHRVAFFGKLAEIVGQYLKKGSSIYVEGSLRTRKWQDKDGQDRYTTEIRGDEMKMLGSRQGGQQDNGGYPADGRSQQGDGGYQGDSYGGPQGGNNQQRQGGNGGPQGGNNQQHPGGNGGPQGGNNQQHPGGNGGPQGGNNQQRQGGNGGPQSGYNQQHPGGNGGNHGGGFGGGGYDDDIPFTSLMKRKEYCI